MCGSLLIYKHSAAYVLIFSSFRMESINVVTNGMYGSRFSAQKCHNVNSMFTQKKNEKSQAKLESSQMVRMFFPKRNEILSFAFGNECTVYDLFLIVNILLSLCTVLLVKDLNILLPLFGACWFLASCRELAKRDNLKL